ncbi:heavy-metal-associated domain-containing protein [Acidovorax sp.]|uniref:heavy-metal-associated domain-containing protein n=1 Tax=Acidovorax sp. TaxID=1872122 RepID=UPI003A102EF3
MVEFNVPDMTCNGCAQRIGRAISEARLPAGVEVEIDVAARKIRIPSLAGDSAVERVRAAVVHAGYRTDAVVVASSHRTTGGCCCAPRAQPSVDVDQGGTTRTSSCCS